MRRLLQNNGSIILEFLLVMPIYFVLIGGTFWIGELLLNRDNLLIADRLATGHWGNRHDWDNDKRKPNDNTIMNRLNMFLFDVFNQNIGDSSIVSEVIQSRAMQHNRYSWSQTIGSKTSLFALQPSWTRGWLHNSDTPWNKKSNRSSFMSVSNTITAQEDVFGLNARISEYNFLNVSLMRTKQGETAYRSWAPARLCHECFQTSCNGYTCIGGIPIANAVWFEKVYKEEYPIHSLDDLKQKMSPQNEDSQTANCGKNKQEDYARFPTYFLWSQ